MSEYRIDELARAAGTTVRNVRVYQERGLLPPPRRDGRVGVYGDAHLARLRLVGQLLGRGYSFAHIEELVSAWEQGRDLGHILGLEQAITTPWSDEVPTEMSATELLEMFGDQVSGPVLGRAIASGLLEIDGDRFRVASPQLLNAGAELVAAGVPLSVVLDLNEGVRADVDASARRFVEAIARHILSDKPPGWLPSGDEIPELAGLINRLRPLARMAVDAHLAQAMDRWVREALGERVARVIDDATDSVRRAG